MSMIETFLAQLGRQGIRLERDEDRLKVHAPKGAMTAEIAGTLRERKAEILSFLSGFAAAKATPNQAVEDTKVPLSFAQQRLWFIDQLTRQDGVSTGTYNIYSTTRILGDLAAESLQAAITQLEMRHDILRARFSEETGKPIQTIRVAAEIKLSLHDLRGKPEEEVHPTIVALCGRGFALSDEPLLRLDLIRLAPQKHLLVLCMHHIISDGWSMGILVRELITLYANAAGMKGLSLDPLPMQYADFAAWQRSPKVAANLEQQATWWKNQLAHLPPLHQVPTDRPRPRIQTQNGATHRVPINRETAQALSAFAKVSGATPFMISLAAFQLLLAKYACQEDIAVGTPIANRNRREIEPLIGFFVNTLVLRTHVDQNRSFLALVEQVKRNTLAAYDHQDIPFEKIVDLLQPVRDNSHSPLFQIMFSLQNQPNKRFAIPGLSLIPEHVETHSAKFDLHLDLVHQEQDLVAVWQFNSDLFNPTTIEAMAKTFHRLLGTVLKNPEQKLSRLSWFDPSPRVRDLNRTHPHYQLDFPAHVYFERQAAIHPSHVALVGADSRASMTYDALNRRANQWAWHLIAQGVKPEDRIALIAENSAEQAIGLLAIFKAGAVAVPLDANLPQQRLLQMLEDSDVKLALSQGKEPELISNISILRLNDVPSGRPTENPRVPIDLDQAAFLIYTSGSTGTPKASINTHRGLVNHHLWMQQIAPMGPHDRMFNKTTISFDAAMWECLLPLMFGAQLALCKPGMEGDPFALSQMLKEHAVTHVFFVPSVLRAVLDLQGNVPLKCSLKHIFCGGEQVQPLDHQRVLNLIENGDGPVHFYNIYGPSECAITCVAHLCQANPTAEFPPIGRPHGYMRAFVVDPHLAEAPEGMPGELMLAGPGLSRGYQHRPALTAMKFVPNPFESDQPGSRLYRTGDLVQLKPDQNLHFVSRIDHQVKLRGVRIELGEIEARLAAQPEIAQAAVVVNHSDKHGQRLIGYLRLEAEADAASLAQVKIRLSQSLPAYMIPSALILLDAMPQLPSGKIARSELAKRPVSFDSSEGEKAFRPPETALQQSLATIWAEVLDLDKVGLDDNFFEIGGHSLLATQVVSRIRTDLEKEISLQQIFAQPTLAALAMWLDDERGTNRLPSMVAVARQDQTHALSFAQQRLWFLDQLTQKQGVSTGTYNVYLTFKVTGELNLAALQQALQHLEMRHEVLRTQFRENQGHPVLVIRPEPAIELQQHDGRSWEEAVLYQNMMALCQRGFSLSEEPLLRLDVIHRSQENHIMVLNMHHIISDGWSMSILVRELIALYQSHFIDEPDALPPLALQYADFAAWQRSPAVTEALQRQAAWWQKHLAYLPVVHQIPTDRPRPRLQTQHGATVTWAIDRKTTCELEALAQASNGTLFMVLLAAFQVLLAKYSGQEDMVVGTPIANRNHKEIEPLIGFFVNTLVLRNSIDPTASFSDLLEQVVRTTLESFDHQDVPFEKVVDLLQPARHTSHAPLFQIMFSLQNMPAMTFSLPNLNLEPLALETDSAKFDLHLNVAETDKGLMTGWQYNTDLFERATIKTMAQNFAHLVAALLQNPQEPLAQIDFMSSAMRQTLVHQWGSNPWSFEILKPAHTYFEQQAENTPDHIALIVDGDTPDLSYADLNKRANQWAWRLREAGIQPESRIALIAQSSPELMVGLLAILKAGGVAVPMDPSAPQTRLQHMLDDSGAQVVLGQAVWVAALDAKHTLCLDNPSPDGSRHDNLELEIHPDRAAFLIYTSGSTGVPKASINTHRGLVNHNLWVQSIAPMQAADRMIYKTPMSFDVALWECLWPLMVGAQLVMGGPGVAGDPRALRRLIEAHAVTHAFFVPSMLRVFLDDLGTASFHSKLCQIFTAGEALLPQDQARVVRQLAGPAGPIQVRNHYGPSEAAISVTSYTCHREAHLGAIPIGRPNGNIQAYVVDQHQNLVPQGLPGELVVGGTGLSRGYQGRPALTAGKFVANPFAVDQPGSRLYRTGDLARFDNQGQLLFLGRIDHQIKLRGMRIELGEIETHLNENPDVIHACVMLSTAQHGEENLVAMVQTAVEDPVALTQSLRAHLKDKLPLYMVPTSYIPLETWPLLSSGKIDYHKLRELANDSRKPISATTYIAPSHAIECALAEIWQDVLHTDQVGLDDNFFEIGGHSLLATQVVSRIRDRLAFEFPLEKMFSLQTLRQQAQWLQEHQTRTSLPRMTPVQRDGQMLKLSFAQQRLWFIDQLTRQESVPSGAYNMSSVLKMKGTLAIKALQTALTQLEMRHEVLRTQFQEIDGAPFQMIRQEPAFRLRMLDYSQTSDDDLRHWIDSSTQRGFALDTDPLLRMDLLLRDEDEFILVLTMHHIISDGWSMNILVQELIATYSEAIGLGPASLPDLDIQYADFAAWQRSDAVAVELDRQASWWETHLAGLPALHQLPTDRPRPPHQTQNGAGLAFQFDPTTTANLEKLANAAGATLFMVVLTAFKIFLAKYSGQKDIVVGTPIANRNRSQVEPLIGFFVNTLVLRDEMDSHLSFRSLLGQIKANTLQSYAHQDVPFEKLVDLLQPERQTSYPPLFQIMFSMQNLPATRVSLADLQIESMEADTVAAKFDLTLDARETPAGLATDWRFNTDLFDHETIQRMMASFKRLIEQILSNPDQSMAQLSLTSQEEWDYQVHALNQTQAPLDYEKPMYAFVEEWAASHPQRLALTAWNGETWTYAELNRRANRIAWQLRELGIATDDRVAVFLQRSPEMIAALLGILKAGAAYVPIDPEYPEQRWTHMLEDSQAPLLLTTTALAPKLGEREHLCVDAMLINSAEETNLNLPFSPDQAFFLIYTSGSSGKPKASVNRHRGMVNYVLWHQSTFPLTADDRVGLKTPFGFDVASWETFWPLVAGASLAIAKPGTSGDPFYLREWLVDHQVTSVYFVPSMLRAFLDSFEEPQFLSPLRFLFTGGEALPTETQQAVLERMAGPEGPLEIHNVYGPSEASLRSAYFSCGKEPRRGIMPIGRSLSNTKAYVVDAHGRMQPLGVPGELQVAGVHTSRGYLGKPALTAERFIPNAFAQQLGDNRIYRTGDLVRRQPHGDLLYLGRVDAQVKLRGMRLELGEIEAQISALEEVDFARVLLNAPSGNQYLVAFIQTQREEKEAVFQRVREALAEELPSYMIPASMIAMDQWPVLPNGKIDGRKLQALAAESQASTTQRSYVAPRNDIEETLCGIWQEVLGLERVGIHDPFFEIGGHSLLATQVLSRMRQAFSERLSLQYLFERPTIAHLSVGIQNIRKSLNQETYANDELREEFEY